MTSDTPTVSSLRVGVEAPAADPQAIPFDPKLPGLRRLFDTQWVWEEFCRRFGAPEKPPDRLRLQHFLYRPGSRAVLGYVAEQRWDDWVAEDHFAFELVAGQEERLFRYPDDPYLPGLRHAASAVDAHQLLSKYVPLHPNRLHVEAVRYRPTVRAVLRHRTRWRRRSTGDVVLYVRVMSPDRVARLVTAGQLAERSGFVLPRLVGCWPAGGVAWLAEIPGKTVRTLIREGNAPEPKRILEGLAPLWSEPSPGNAGQTLDVAAAFRRTQRVLSQVLPEGDGQRMLRHVARALRPFAEAWRPSALAHNDFYDDQLIVTPTGRIAVIDFEETGPGDPMLDVGNMLAHLRWMARLSSAPEAFGAYHRELRSAALERFGWEEQALALREAFALFRLSANPVRQFQPGWLGTVEKVLAMVAEALDEGATPPDAGQPVGESAPPSRSEGTLRDAR